MTTMKRFMLVLLLGLSRSSYAFVSPHLSGASLATTSVFPNAAMKTTRNSALHVVVSTRGDDDDKNRRVADYDAIAKYHVAIMTEMLLIAAVLRGLDVAVDAASVDLPIWATVPVFYAFSLKSRVFNPLNNARPNLSKAVKGNASRGFGDRIMPSWTPPGVVFPIMWLLVIGPMRAFSSALVYDANGHVFCDGTIMALMFHLSVGDVWNTINNTERRFGAAVTAVLCVTASAVHAAFQYYQVDPTAGKLLGSLPIVWFGIASSLVTATWQLNNQEEEPLYPLVRESTKTEFAWFQNNE